MVNALRLKPFRINQTTLLFPPAIWLGLFLLAPLFIVLIFSFMHKGHYGQVEYFFDASNYLRVFEPIYLKIIFRSFSLAGFTTLACLVLGYPFAYFMARSSSRMRNALLAMVIIPFWTNFVVRVYALKILINDNGLINRFLINIGVIAEPIAMTNTLFGVYLGMIYNYLPFTILPLYVFLERFDFTLLDAAHDLGASPVRTFFKVLFPLSMPGILTGSLFVFIPSFGEFVIPDLLGGAQSMYVGNLITETFLKSRDWPFGSALSSFLVLFAMVGFVFILKKGAEKAI